MKCVALMLALVCSPAHAWTVAPDKPVEVCLPAGEPVHRLGPNGAYWDIPKPVCSTPNTGRARLWHYDKKTKTLTDSQQTVEVGIPCRGKKMQIGGATYSLLSGGELWVICAK